MAGLVFLSLLSLATITGAFVLPPWRRAIGPTAELVILGAVLVLRALEVIPRSLLPDEAAVLGIAGYALARAQKLLSLSPDPAPADGATDVHPVLPRWRAIAGRFLVADKKSVESSLHLLPFLACLLFSVSVNRTCALGVRDIAFAVLVGFMVLNARRAGMLLIGLQLSLALAASWLWR